MFVPEVLSAATPQEISAIFLHFLEDQSYYREMPVTLPSGEI